MHFSRVGKFLGASRITGPHHNMLQLCLSEGSEDKPVLDCLPPIGDCTHATLDPDKLLAAVLEGVATANNELGTTYSATHVRYVANDTPPEIVYGLLALSIIRHLASSGTFVEA